jgi:hypothetical protein
MTYRPPHRTVRRFRVERGWWAACLSPGCRWTSEPGPYWQDAKDEGRVHELYPDGVDWSRVEAWR